MPYVLGWAYIVDPITGDVYDSKTLKLIKGER